MDAGLMTSNLGGRPSRRSRSSGADKDVPIDDGKIRTFIADMYAAMSLLRLLRQEIASALSLSSAEYSVVLAVWYLERDGDMTLRAIADHLHVAAPYVTAEVGKLVEKGLLTKQPDPLDRRAITVELTTASRKLLSCLGPMLREVNEPLMAGMSARDLEIVHRFFFNVISHGHDTVDRVRHRKGLRQP